MSNVYARMTSLKTSSGGAKGRVDYISDPERQEKIVCFYSTVDLAVWDQLSKERREEHKSSGRFENCVEAKEITVALPHAWFERKEEDQIARQLAEDFGSTYGVPCAVAVHSKSGGKNIHAHIVFSESELLEEPDIKIASRNMFYDENGKRCRTKKDILGDDGTIRPGCSIIKKGEIYKAKYFGPKKDELRANNNLIYFKQHYADMLDLEVFDRKKPQLAQIKYGKGNPNEEAIKEYNREVQQFNKVIEKGLEKNLVSDSLAMALTEDIRKTPVKQKNSTLKKGLGQLVAFIKSKISEFRAGRDLKPLNDGGIAQNENLSLDERIKNIRQQAEQPKFNPANFNQRRGFESTPKESKEKDPFER